MIRCQDCGVRLPERAPCQRCGGLRCEYCCDERRAEARFYYVLHHPDRPSDPPPAELSRWRCRNDTSGRP